MLRDHRPAGGRRARAHLQQGGADHLLDRPGRERHLRRQARRVLLRVPRGRPAHRPAEPDVARADFARGDHRVLGMVTPIYNEASCSTAAVPRAPGDRSACSASSTSRCRSHAHRRAAARDLRATTIAVGTLALVAFGARHRAVRAALGPPARSSRLVAATAPPGAAAISRTARRSTCRADELGELEQLVQRDGALAGRAARRAPRAAQLARAAGRGAHGGAEARAGAAGALREAVVARPPRRVDRARDQQPARRHPHLRQAADPHPSTIRPTSDPARASAVKQLRLVQRETERCSAIVRNLLDFARERPLDLKDVSVNQVLEDALALVGNQARLANIDLVKDSRGRARRCTATSASCGRRSSIC